MGLPFRQIHLDCHTPVLPYKFGNKFDKIKFQKTLLNAKVNSITLTGRCHHGHIYYDTKLEAKHPNLTNDFLMELVDACHEVGIRCPIYLTVGWDAFMAKKHPEYLEIDENGCYYGFDDYGQLNPGWKTICFNSPYLDYLSKQIKDTMEHFAGKLDGLFFDILWQDPCFCNHCIDKMLKAGFNPENKEEVKQFASLTEINTKQIITNIIKQIDPNCAIFFNEGNISPKIRNNLDNYSHIEIESLPSSSWGYQHFPVAVRYAKNLGKEYVGMTARFHRGWADFGSYKNINALEYECLLAIAHGGRCSIGDQMYGDGTLSEYAYQLIGEVYHKVEKVEEFAEDVVSTANIAILYTTSEGQKVDLSLGGVTNMLNELDYQFDIIDEYINFEKYQLIILADKVYLTDSLERKLYNYWNNGGKLLISYHSGLLVSNHQYPDWMGLTYQKDCEYTPTYIDYPKLFDAELVVHGKSVCAISKHDNEANLAFPIYQRTYQHYYGHYHAPMDRISEYPAFLLNNGIIFCAHNVFEVYRNEEVRMLRDAISSLIDETIGSKEIMIENFPKYGDVVLNYQEKEHRFILNLLYYVPTRRALNIDTIEDKVPLYNIKIHIKKSLLRRYTNKEIKHVYMPLTNQSIHTEQNSEYLSFFVSEVDGYQVAIIECE